MPAAYNLDTNRAADAKLTCRLEDQPASATAEVSEDVLRGERERRSERPHAERRDLAVPKRMIAPDPLRLRCLSLGDRSVTELLGIVNVGEARGAAAVRTARLLDIPTAAAAFVQQLP
jgi:hypothetical protein